MTFFLQVQVKFLEGWNDAHVVVANGASQEGGGSQHVAVGDLVAVHEGEKVKKKLT